MNQFLRNLTAEQQVSALFIIVFGLLFIASATVFMLSLRERGDDAGLGHGETFSVAAATTCALVRP